MRKEYLGILLFCSSTFGAVYQVGTGKQFTAIGEVPWATLQPGDQVWIHWRATPYREKWVIGRSGTATAPITVRGIANSLGQKPVIEGSGAVTPTNLNFWNEARGLIKLGGSSVPNGASVSYVIVDGFEVRNAYPGNQFRNKSGTMSVYASNAAGIYIERGDHLTIRNCLIQGNANGIFISSGSNYVTSDIMIERNVVRNNGTPGSSFHHNAYTEAAGITYQYNYFGPPRADSIGNSLKDRSAGLVVRYNYFFGGNRQLDLTESDTQVLYDPRYGKTFVYGNYLVEPEGAGNSQLVHYGGDNGNTATYRKGTLYFYNNTLVSYRAGNTRIMRLSTNDEFADIRNNILHCTGPTCQIFILDDTGIVDLTSNWIRQGWKATSSEATTPRVADRGGNIVGLLPGLVNALTQDLRLTATSPLINSGAVPHADTAAYLLTREYLPVARVGLRPNDGILDIGAWEYRTFSSLPPGLPPN